MNGDFIPNHGYVMISDIGSTDNTALLCITNKPTPNGSSDSGEGTGLHQMETELVVLLFQDLTGAELL